MPQTWPWPLLWETRQGLASCQVEPPAALSLGLPSTAGWLLNLQHLTLGAQIGEGEFGGEQGT